MKFNTPRSPCLSGGFPLLEKGGGSPLEGGATLGAGAYPTRPSAQVSQTGTALCSSS
jgi:hypothetical protein